MQHKNHVKNVQSKYSRQFHRIPTIKERLNKVQKVMNATVMKEGWCCLFVSHRLLRKVPGACDLILTQ